MTRPPATFSSPNLSSNGFTVHSTLDGALWFTEPFGNAIGRLSTDFALSEFVLPDSFNNPEDIAVGSDGALWFTSDTGKIGRITTSGELSAFAVSDMPLLDIVAGPDGTLWFYQPGDPPMLRSISTQGELRDIAQVGLSIYGVCRPPDQRPRWRGLGERGLCRLWGCQG